MNGSNAPERIGIISSPMVRNLKSERGYHHLFDNIRLTVQGLIEIVHHGKKIHIEIIEYIRPGMFVIIF